jgi:protease PrsW
MLEYIIGAYVLLAIWLYRYFMKSDRGAKEPARAIKVACWFGVLALVVAMIGNGVLLPAALNNYLDAADAPYPGLMPLLYASLTIGVIEEFAKFLPLALYLYPKKYFNETTDGVVYFGLAGMWFGVLESIIYTLGGGIGVGILRIVVAPFLHAGFSSLAGIGLIRFKLTRNPLYLIMGLGMAILFHGVYDFFLFSHEPGLIIPAILLAVAVNLGPFRYFKQARKQDEKLGLSAIGVNRFCRKCGKPNPKANLYCTYCGEKT